MNGHLKNPHSKIWEIAAAALNMVMILACFVGVFFSFAQWMEMSFDKTVAVVYLLVGIGIGYAVPGVAEEILPREWSDSEKKKRRTVLLTVGVLTVVFVLWNLTKLMNGVVRLADFMLYAYNQFYNSGEAVIISAPYFEEGLFPELANGNLLLGRLRPRLEDVNVADGSIIFKGVQHLFNCCGFLFGLWRTTCPYNRKNALWSFFASASALIIALIFGYYDDGVGIYFFAFYVINLLFLLNQTDKNRTKVRKKKAKIQLKNPDSERISVLCRVAAFALMVLLVGVLSPMLSGRDYNNFKLPSFDVAGLGEEEETTTQKETQTEEQTLVSAEDVTFPNVDMAVSSFGELELEEEMRRGSNTMYLKVTSGVRVSQLYLKGYTGEIYTGKSWVRMTEDYVNDIIPNPEYELGTYYSLPYAILTEEAASVRDFFESGGDNAITVEYMTDIKSAQYIPYYANSSFYEIMSSDVIAVMNFANEDWYSQQNIIDKGTRYAYDTRTNTFRGQFANSPANYVTSFMDEFTQSYEESYLRLPDYLEVPDSLTRFHEEFSTVTIDDVTYDLGDGLCLADEVGIGKCINYVISYLSNHVAYTLDTQGVAEGADYIESFLFDTKEGYCSHHASAAVMMFRKMGIPARYCTGFALTGIAAGEWQETADGYCIPVTGKAAHAWPEIYLNGFGWVPVEVTFGGSMDDEPETTTPIWQANTPGEQRTTPPAAQETETTEAAGEPAKETFAAFFKAVKNILRTILRIIAIPAILLALVLGTYRIRKWRWERRLNKKSCNERIAAYGAEIDRRLSYYLHYKKENKDTADKVVLERAFFVKTAEKQGKILTAEQYEDLLNRARYSNENLTASDEKRMYLTMQRIEKQLNEESSLWKKIKKYLNFQFYMVR